MDFCVEHFCCGSRDVFRMFLNNLIFDPNWLFCKGYSPCIIADFSDFGTLVIFRILGVFLVDFCVEHVCCASRDVFRMFLNPFNFWPKLTILHIFPILENLLHSNIRSAWSGIFGVDFCVEHLCRGPRDVFCMFLNNFLFDPNWRFCKGYSPCNIPNFSDFRTLGIFLILGVFGGGFCVEHFWRGLRDVFWFFACFWTFYFWPKLTILQGL